MENIKRIEKYDSAFAVIEACTPELLDLVTDKARDILSSFDDYEAVVHYVINDEIVISADAVNGDTTGRTVTVKQFFFECLEYCADFA